ncbi:MAG: NTP transferase domain-containing protein [Thermoprotei archaeon]
MSDSVLPFPDGAIVMCGGKAERFGGRDKGCIFFHGKPLAERVCEALRKAGLKVIFAFTLRTSCSAAYAGMVDGVSLLETPGQGYVEDLRYVSKWASSHFAWRRALVTACDMPLFNKEVVRKVLEQIRSTHAPIVNVVISGDELSSLGFKVSKKELISSVSMIDLMELSLSDPKAELAWESVKYSPAYEIWDCDDESSLEIFDRLWRLQRENGTTS